jgi:predicted nucleic acid-binding protein
VNWIIDASVALKWFIEEETHPHADEVLAKLIDQPIQFAVPELFTFEVYAVLQRTHPYGLEVFRKAVIPILQGGIFRHPMTEKLAIKADRYIKMGLSGYDACYAALASDLNGVWLTFDGSAHRLIQKEQISCLLDKDLPQNWPE